MLPQTCKDWNSKMLKGDKDHINSKAWPFVEAQKLLNKFKHKDPEKGYVLFETGYGPSGLPHIGTFGEVVRTSMIKRAFEEISDIPTKLICFSDDMDGLRKVPTNVPNTEMLEEDLHLPLSKVRDPFKKFDSFAQYNNNRLINFLDDFSFSYEFASSTEYYQKGFFDETLLKVLSAFEEVMEIMLPSLGLERKKSYSPFMPISKKTGHVLQVPTLEVNPEKGTLVYQEPDGEKVETEVTGGNVKLQWKPDWAMRWCALGVDYEMYGKDLIPSSDLAARICRCLGFQAPEVFNYELFLDKDGQKISKSKGNGLSVNDWLTYAEPSSLSFFMYQKPKTAKRLFFDVIPKTVDEYHRHLKAYPEQQTSERLDNPVWHIHLGNPPNSDLSISFSMLLNLTSAAGAEDKHTLWGFLKKYNGELSPESNPGLDDAVNYALAYYKDFVEPAKKFRLANHKEAAALRDLALALKQDFDETSEAECIQRAVYSIGKENNFEPLKEWFSAIYEVLLGSSEGPRLGGFIKLYGVEKMAKRIDKALAGKLV